MPREFEIRREVVLPASPEDVFAAVTSGTGAWMFPKEKVAAVGGSDAEDDAVTVWEPPHRFEVRVDGEDGWFNALEYVIEARDGGTAVLRYVHSGVMSDEDWDGQYDGARLHTDFYLHTLGQYLRYFTGRPAAFADVQGPAASRTPDGFGTLLRALGATATTAVGDRLRLELPGTAPLDAVVDYRTEHFLGLRTDGGLYRFFGRNAFGAPVGLTLHLFEGDTDAEKAGRAWQHWLDGLYPVEAAG
ncbi:SRPBCC family protein [Streptomyces kronopolitis]|uniref:SRPBCC family protein n=1 Tax=Streptomyces kronopolitis TaxID=1612435 RepID=UPI0020BE7DD1|nr:SRPBCC domain-containing protein [Streptomyces kronopolitis]MCL6302304.1 SRPBCC domain-containing protein [Streptomyces kronopolitis]